MGRILGFVNDHFGAICLIILIGAFVGMCVYDEKVVQPQRKFTMEESPFRNECYEGHMYMCGGNGRSATITPIFGDDGKPVKCNSDKLYKVYK